MPKNDSVRFYLLENFFVASLLILSVGVCFYSALSYGILKWDSQQYTQENICVHGLTWENFTCIFTKPYFLNWHPITSLSYALEYEHFGENPRTFHFNNLFIHAINSFLIYQLTKKVVTIIGGRGWSVYVAASISALLFAVHPQHVETVVWIAERKGLLSTMFFLLAISSYLKFFTSRKKWLYYILSLLAFTCSLLSKPMAVTMPVLLILIDIFPLCRVDFSSRIKSITTSMAIILWEKTPYFIIAISMSWVTINTFDSGGAVASLDQMSIIERSLNAIYSLYLYIKLWFLPLELSPLYTHPAFILERDLLSLFVLVVGFGSVIIALLVLFIKGHSSPLISFLLIVVSLLPVIGLLRVGSHSAADRYTYLPLIPMYIAAGHLLSKLIFSRRRLYQVSAFVGTLVLVIFLINITKTQVKVWKNELSLWIYVNSDWLTENSTTLPRTTNINKVVWLAQAYYDAGDYDSALKYYLLAEDLGQLPNLWQYLRFARAYAFLGHDFYALQVYSFLLKHPECCEALLQDKIESDVAEIKLKSVGTY